MPSIYFSAEASHISPMLATVSRNLIMRQHVSSINPKMWCSSSPSLKLPKWSICLTFSSRMTSKIVRAQHQRETTSYSFLLSFTFPAERASSHLIQRLGVMTWKSALIHMYYLLSLQKSLCELASRECDWIDKARLATGKAISSQRSIITRKTGRGI